ncbi:TetR family transcriptional regulator [Hydrogenivirga caldilitoris]|uniref:TetR family transcriptional regulator n=1 Tax=Hydrogenivirga caldilitoris TaxID=246264 RepID=A0A497XMC4_9AQUI|nr:TetR/AcrR family transcriptional regulator [Hydrogenivirga caldilitoris]RLJ70047.1 TetR family transcriptional regulator [Hydrogenivirga caldilitoris]
MSVHTRGRLIEAAKKVFSRKGYHNAQIAHIIDEAGVARGTFYLYFRSKEDIFKELLKEVVEELKERIRVIDPFHDPVEQVIENVERVIEFALEERELARIVLQRNSDPDLFRVINDFFEEVTRLIENSLWLGIEMGLIRECDTHLIARGILGALKEVISSLLDEENPDTYRVAKEIIELGMKGVWKPVGGESHGGNSAV